LGWIETWLFEKTYHPPVTKRCGNKGISENWQLDVTAPQWGDQFSTIKVRLEAAMVLLCQALEIILHTS